MRTWKKQTLAFFNISRFNELPFVTNNLEISIEQGIDDPRPLNRKSRRAMPKLINKILNRKPRS